MKVNKKMAAVAGLGALALVGGSFAYYFESGSLDNPLSTGKYNTQLVEDFTPPTEDMKPGVNWDKVVSAQNTGDYPVLVRIKMDEKWVRKGETDPYKELHSIEDYDKFNTVYEKDGTYPSMTVTADQVDDNDGDTPEEDKTVVYKNILTNDGWVDGGDGWWYWNGVLEKKGSGKDTTTELMKGLVMATNIDLGEYNTSEYYVILDKDETPDDNTAWTDAASIEDTNEDGVKDVRDITIPEGKKLFRKSESELNTEAQGYADSNYTLTITSEFVQATKDAVEENWGTGALSKMDKVEVDDDDDGDGVNLKNKDADDDGVNPKN